MSSLPALQAGVPIVDQTGSPTQFFLTYLQQITSGLSNSSGASMPTLNPVSILADPTNTSVILTGQLPKIVQIQRFLNGDDVSAKCRWFLSTVSGTITASIDQGGFITITALGSNSVLQVKSVRDGLTLTCNVTVNRVVGSAPTSSGGSSSVSTSVYGTINSTSYSDITGDLSVVVGSSGNISLAANLIVGTSNTSPQGFFGVYGKWIWWNGTAWVDVAPETRSSPDCEVDNEPPHYIAQDGELDINATQSGLTVGSTQKFRISARNNSGTRVMSLSGSANLVP